VRRSLPWIILGVFSIYVAACLAAAMMRPVRSRGGFNLAAFGRLPAALNGRVQPIDSVARLGLLQIRGAVTLPLENTRSWQFWRRTRLDATEWLLELLTTPDMADGRKIFPIQDPTLIGTLGLNAAESGPVYHAFAELAPKLDAIGKHALRITKLKAASRAPWERELLKLRNALVIYEGLKNTLQPNSFLQHEARGKPVGYDFAALLTQYQADLRVGVKAAIARQHGAEEPLDKATEERMRAFARPYASVSRAGLLAVIPPADPTKFRDRWHNIGTMLVDSARTGYLPLPVGHFAAMSSAFVQGRPEVFNGVVTKYRQWLTSNGLAPEASKARYEFFYNLFQPFVRAIAIYLVAFLLVCASWFKRSTALYRSAAMLIALAWVLHTAGLSFDMMLEGRPPVTNVYASVIFAGWGVVLLAATVEWYWHNGVGMVTAPLAGLIALIVAHSLAPGGAVGVMRAALDMSFWLAAVAMVIALHLGRDAGTRPEPSVTESARGSAGKASRWRLGILRHRAPSF